MRGSWKREDQDSDSELGDRTDGTDARALTSVIGAGGGYIPLHKEPPRYIRVRPHNKKRRDFDRLFLAQELLGAKPETPQERAPATAVGTKLLKAGAAIWTAEFSVDGRYMAVAGKDQVVRVFSVLSTPEERRAHEAEEEERGEDAEKLSAPVFCSKPVREFKGHAGDVLALSWSKNNFLLSSSMDKTVRLWHMSRSDCLCTFKHSDLVTSIAFHPTDDRFFLAGSLDGELRLWSIPDKSVAFSASIQEFITAVAFSPDGKTAICGLLSGVCHFYETEGLKHQHQIHVRSSRGKNAKGSKITGIRTAQADENADVKVLISSNDSRVRIYNLKTKMLEVKLKGLENQSSQIHARFSNDAKYVISGSEDRRAYIWDMSQPDADKQPYECFDAHPEVVTVALMAPTKSKQLLSASGDPLYDLCNPPPVTLLSLNERTASQVALSDEEPEARKPEERKPEEKPAYVERSKHHAGNIIITADRTGTIKVFRQDCAWSKRQQNLWETGSRFSGKFNSVGRSGSIVTRASGGSRVHSRRASLNLGPTPMPQPTSDRIMSWRQDIEQKDGSVRSARSMSPTKAQGVVKSTPHLSGARKPPYSPSLGRPTPPLSPVSKVRVREPPRENLPSVPPTPSFSIIHAEEDEDDRDKTEGGFWSRWRVPTLRYSSGGPAPSTLGPAKRITGRRSMGLDEISRQRMSDEGRRKSFGALRRTTEVDEEHEGDETRRVQDKEAKREEETRGKKRVDSGVGQLSDEDDRDP
ncbi:WD40-repeat-containing domain protein [Stachybotrys elegans]|uniref:WD40-repeat-containing domain protein n=1 Tax=Stachybotrys elegans TaxID=80388 RepID=A0A8K0SG89_9HYPO|nr:WD40-repeat-containing domain protein [Stachybotrys elegans]